jgi:hypothetical protein
VSPPADKWLSGPADADVIRPASVNQELPTRRREPAALAPASGVALGRDRTAVGFGTASAGAAIPDSISQ